MDERMNGLVATLPALVGAPGCWPREWNPAELDAWAVSLPPCSQTAHVARFALSVWGAGPPWRAGRFDVVAAWPYLDPDHRAAVLGWLREPFWP